MARSRLGSTDLPDEYLLERYLQAFTASSNRVRYVIFVLITVCVLVFAGLVNSVPRSWTNTRVKALRVALNHQLWRPEREFEPGILHCLQSPESETRFWLDSPQNATCREISNARRMVLLRGLADAEQVKARLGALEEAQVERVLALQAPFFGFSLDVNDLGTISGLTLAILSIVLLISLSRQYENLFLCSFLLRQLVKADGTDNRLGKANFLYHALAMAQLFSRPPTLARWKHRIYGRAPKVLFLMPVVLHLAVCIVDWHTFAFGTLLRPFAAPLFWKLNVVALGVIVAFMTMSILYSMAADRLWLRCFQDLNPVWWQRNQRGWFCWLFQAEPKEVDEESEEARATSAASAESAAGSDCSPISSGSDGRRAATEQRHRLRPVLRRIRRTCLRYRKPPSPKG